jgi:hypothetical protein
MRPGRFALVDEDQAPCICTPEICWDVAWEEVVAQGWLAAPYFEACPACVSLPPAQRCPRAV